MNFARVVFALLVSISLFAGNPALADHHKEKLPSYAERGMTVEVEARVMAVDVESRQVMLEMPTGEQFTTYVDEAVQRLDEINAGDVLVVVYATAIAADLREPTAEEIANPWVEGADVAVADADSAPAGGEMYAVRAVCTIEGMNRLNGTVTILDSRGKVHVIGDVKPERIEELRVGQSVVMTFTQAVAVGIKKVDSVPAM